MIILLLTTDHESSGVLDLDNTLNISRTSILEVNNIKFLGLTINNPLSWIPHNDNLHINLNLQQAYLNASETIFLKPRTNPCTMLFLRAIYLIVITVFGIVCKAHSVK